MSEALSAALALLVGLDSRLVEIVLLSLRVSLSAWRSLRCWACRLAPRSR